MGNNPNETNSKMKADTIISLFSQLNLVTMTEVIRELEKIRNENLGDKDKNILEVKL
jgi:hypothetical protein